MVEELALEVVPLAPELLPALVVAEEEDALPPSDETVVKVAVLESATDPADVAASVVAAVESAVVVAVWAAANASSTNAQRNERKRCCIVTKRACERRSDSGTTVPHPARLHLGARMTYKATSLVRT